MTDQDRTITGQRRRRHTRLSVRVSDWIAQGLITVGGIATIGAVALVCVYLASVVVPLFQSPSIEATGVAPVSQSAERSQSPPERLVVSEEMTSAALWRADGTADLLDLKSGAVAERLTLAGEAPTAFRASPTSGEFAAGYGDGSIRLGALRLDAAADGGPRGSIKVDEPIVSEEPSPIALIDFVSSSSGSTIAYATTDGTLRVLQTQTRRNMLTRKVTRQVESGDLPLPVYGDRPPSILLLFGLGENVLVAWPNGHALRFDTRDTDSIRLVEELDLIEGPSETLTAAEFLLGRATVIVGDSAGNLRAWFRTRPRDQTDLIDGQRLVAAHDLPSRTAPVTAIASSARMRIVAAGYQDGRVRLFYVTGGRLLVELPPAGKSPIEGLTLAVKDDGLASLSADGLATYKLDLKHPEASLATLFRPVWYEEYPRPEHVWQSSSGSQATEPKMGLMPLVFGTLKATTFSMLFGVPLALLAAVYTSEFLHYKVKAKIKPTIELMASLPSVVLGFLAALVFAPVVERMLPAVLSTILTVPFAVAAGSYLWQLAPQGWTLRWERLRLAFVLAAFAIGLLLAYAIGPFVERLLFAGDVMAWLDGQIGRAAGGWVFLLLPATAVASYVIFREVNSWLRRVSHGWSRTKAAWVDLGKFLLAVATIAALTAGAALLLDALGLDPRGSLVDTYNQRNALIVGFVMGFAIIPIIYTIAEDALSTVPQHLRSASYGAGATPWQTAMRVVVPTAMSGLFSAVMVGLGRAVGETMIVLMAAGNTPLTDVNIFNGFRTLSANIAVELPEAVRDSTHYRTLFLAALVLFAITFLLNTVAEIVRQRFRRRAYEL